ncbi:glycerol dehydrogenase [Parendozoicomonas haliclonae]|uniref:Glycerol dehydrogenase n=1 Tax=Parendozoicomonas haliclonae TaxID=1960125 RepID=A0A1X7APV9_9GAMM|nr:glycerol dehydrogenase [Parendozoicomonas haliclonae]SMA50129.1 Glycerol dehydrogenase [Parendozoicomonas haliclonae]
MEKVIIAPGKYVQGYDVLSNISRYVKPLGQKPLAIADNFVAGLVGGTVRESFLQDNMELILEQFNGECSRPEIERIQAICQSAGADVIIGFGGGKTLDTAKAVGYYAKIPVVIVPTIASSDAPTSALSVIYTPEGEFSEYLLLPKNPDMVMMDTKVISQAPARLLVSGMGDALSTYFEARANRASGHTTMAGGQSTQAAFVLAELCYKTLLADGLKARLAVESDVCTKAVENIVEANTYLSGIGFESSGLAAAHAIHNGFTHLSECHHLFHGEKVAFGTLTQLVLENAPLKEINTLIDFCQSVGLPTTLAEMGIKEATPEKLRIVAEGACAEGETIHNMPFPVTADAVVAALITADKLGAR